MSKYKVKIVTNSCGCSGSRYFYEVNARNKEHAKKKAIAEHIDKGYRESNITRTEIV